MSNALRPWLPLACLTGFAAVAGGAFGAHALASHLEPRFLEAWDTGARYAMFHVVALVVVAWRVRLHPHERLPAVAGVAFCLGVLLFTGSLWTMALTEVRWLGAITPLGGLSLLAGWLCLGLHAWKTER